MDYCASVENIEQPEKVKIIIGDILDQDLLWKIFNENNIDTIVHFAAQTHVDNSFWNSLEFTKNNTLGTHVLLEVSRKYHESVKNIYKLINTSSDEVLGEVLDDKIRDENSVLNAINPYASSKAGAEIMAMSYYKSYALPVISVRINNVFGSSQFNEKIIPKFICLLLNDKKLPIQGTGEAKRNYINVDDVISGYDVILRCGKVGEIYNISVDNEHSVLQIAQILLTIFGKIGPINDYIEFIEDRRHNDLRYYMSSEKLQKLGWKVEKTNFVEELKILIEFYRNNQHRYII